MKKLSYNELDELFDNEASFGNISTNELFKLIHEKRFVDVVELDLEKELEACIATLDLALTTMEPTIIEATLKGVKLTLGELLKE